MSKFLWPFATSPSPSKQTNDFSEITRQADAIGVPDNVRERPSQKQELTWRTTYSAAPGVTTNTPVRNTDGVLLSDGSRAYAEAFNVTGPASLQLTLTSSNNGLRCVVDGNGVNITGGSIQFWVMDPTTEKWFLSTASETLQTGYSQVATSDQFVTVGAR